MSETRRWWNKLPHEVRESLASKYYPNWNFDTVNGCDVCLGKISQAQLAKKFQQEER